MNLPSRQRIIYLVQESCLFLTISYLVLLGGTFNGLVLPKLNVVNLVLIILVGVSWFAYRIIGKLGVNRTGLDLGVLLIIITGIISTIFSTDPRRSVIGLVILAIVILIYYLFVDLIKSGLQPQLINKVLILVSGFILFFGFWELIAWYSEWLRISGTSQLVPEATYRVRAFLGHPNFLAAYLNLIIPIVFVSIVGAKKRIFRLILIAWLGMALILVFFTSSRGGWLGTFIALLVFFLGVFSSQWEWIKQKLRHQKQNKMVLFVFGLLFIFGIAGVFFLLKWQSNHPTHPSDWTNILASRDYIWIVARDMFAANPLTGNGLFTFGTEYLKVESIPPNMLLAHSHNYYFNVAGEQGVVGLLALATYIVSFLLILRKAWGYHKYLNKIELSGLAAAIFGLAAHSFFETPQSLPVLLILPAIIIAQITAGLEWKNQPKKPIFKNILLIGLWIAAVIFVSLDYRVLQNYEKGLDFAAEGNWKHSSIFFDKVTDQDPNNGLYWFQRGQVYGMMALDEFGYLEDEAALEKAINSYETGLDIESNYSVNWMNLGLLYKAEGDFEQAQQAIEIAVTQSPLQPYFQITLGNLYEILGQDIKAKEVYQEVLLLRPEWVNIQYFQDTAARKILIDNWVTESINENDEANPLGPIQKLYSNGRYLEALGLLEDLNKNNNPEAYELLGSTYFQMEEFGKAEKALRTVLWMGPRDQLLRAKTYWELGDTAVVQGDEGSALSAYLAAFDLLDRTSSYGVGKKGETQYSWYLFYKNSIKDDLLPGAIKPVYSEGMVSGLTYLVNLYCSGQQVELAENAMNKLDVVRYDVLKVESIIINDCTK